MYIDTDKMQWAKYTNPLGARFFTAEEMHQMQMEIIVVNDGYYLVVKSGGVECLGENANPYDMEAYEKAQALAGAFSTLLRNAGGILHTVAYGQEAYQKWTEQVSTVMQYLDIDTTKDFTINGMKYSKNEKGDWESSSNSIAKAAYE